MPEKKDIVVTHSIGGSTHSTVSPQVGTLRVALLPWMVAGVQTQYENIRAFKPPPQLTVDIFPIFPYKDGGLIEHLPLLRSTQKGTLRSAMHALPLLDGPPYDVIWAQALLPLIPLLLASGATQKPRPAIVYAIDTTPALMDGFSRIYYGISPGRPLKRGLRDFLYRYALRRCVAVTPWSHWAARSFMRDYGVPAEHIHVIPPGVDLSAWSVPAHRYSPTYPGEERRPFRLLFVGADFERKGGPLLLDIFRQHLRTTCELHLVTKAAVVEEPGVRVYREFGRNEPGLRDLYERSDAFVLPTRADCFSMASIEAMACGLPVISCPVGGIPEIVQPEETGFLVPPDDGRSLLSAIQALTADPARTTMMGLAGRRVAKAKFDNTCNSAALFALLQRFGHDRGEHRVRR